MQLIDFDNCRINDRFYGGLSGKKVGLIYNNENYIIKYPSDLKIFGSRFGLSYSNSPVCEYIGSHIYSILFDNGNSLCNKWSEEKMQNYMNLPEKERIIEAVRTPSVYRISDRGSTRENSSENQTMLSSEEYYMKSLAEYRQSRMI